MLLTWLSIQKRIFAIEICGYERQKYFDSKIKTHIVKKNEKIETY